MNSDSDDTPYPYSGPEALRKPIEQALMRVVDPEVAMTIVDVGLVYGVTLTPTRLHAVVTMTSAACPVTDMILDDVETELLRVAPEGVEVDVELVWDPPWTTERMSPRGRAFMGW
jgi:metal-sulfur cluster biosynthetic enzyme